MKKVLAWVLALALVLSTFAMSFATYTDEALQKELNCESQVAALSALGVVKGYPGGEYKPSNEVTRAEMAALVIRAMGNNDVQKSGFETKYTDVSKDDWFSGVVKQATDLELIEGYPDGSFKPNGNVTYNEAITMIVRALGYEEEYLKGKWPANFKTQAKTINLYDGISLEIDPNEEVFNDPATRGNVAIMLYNALDEVMVTYEGNQLLRNADTFLNRLATKLDVDKIVLEQDMIVQMCDIVDSAVLDEELLGAPITAMTFDGVVASVYSVNAEKYELEDVNKGEVTIGDEDYAFSGSLGWFFYNGYVSVPNTDMLNGGGDGFVWANINDTKGSIDIDSTVVWKATKTVQWTQDDINKLQRGNFNEHYICNKKAIDPKHFFLKGAESLDKIAEGNIVTFYFANIYEPVHGYAFEKIATNETDKQLMLNRDDRLEFIGTGALGITANSNLFFNAAIGAGGEEPQGLTKKAVVSKVEVGTKTVEGTVSETSQNNNTAKIDGVDYTRAILNYCVEGLTEGLAGKTGTFYLNYRGEIAAFDPASVSNTYGIYLDGKPEFEYYYASGMKKTEAFELFTAVGEETWFPVLNDADVKTDRQGDQEDSDQLVKYSVDADGSIDALDFRATWLESDTKVTDNRIGDLPVADDVVVFTRDAFLNGNWKVTEFADLKDVTLKGEKKIYWNHRVIGTEPQTEYFLNNGVVEAIACNYCIADEAGAYLFIEDWDFHPTSGDKGYYSIKFVGDDETYKTNDEWVDGHGDITTTDRLVYVTFESNGEIKTVKATEPQNGRLGMELDPGEVYQQILKTYKEEKTYQGQQYIVDNAGKTYPVNGAKFYEYDGTTVKEFEGAKIGGDIFTVIQTTSEGSQYDIVLIYKNDINASSPL